MAGVLEGKGLEGKVVAITGGGRGIGFEIARAVKAQGAIVCIGDIDLPLAQRSADTLGIQAEPLDVREADSFSQFIVKTEQTLGPIDVLINNAGIMPMGRFVDEDPHLSDAQIDINLRGVILGMRLVLPSMLARQQGHIINIASMAGRFAIPGSAVYAATKYAVIGLTESVAAENRRSGVNFSAIMPSKVTTDLALGTDEAAVGIPSVSPEDVATTVVAVLKRPRMYAGVPDYLRFTHAMYGLMPARLSDLFRRLVGDNRILDKLDKDARASYVKRINSIAGIKHV